MKIKKSAWKDIVIAILIIAVAIWPAGFIADVKGWPDYYAKSSEQAEELFLEKLEQLDSVLERYDLHTTPHTKSIDGVDDSTFFSEVYLDDGESILIDMAWWGGSDVTWAIRLYSTNCSTAESCVHNLDEYPYIYEMASCLSDNRISPRRFYQRIQNVQKNAIEELQQYPTHANDWSRLKYFVLERATVDYTIEQTGDSYQAIVFFLLYV